MERLEEQQFANQDQLNQVITADNANFSKIKTVPRYAQVLTRTGTIGTDNFILGTSKLGTGMLGDFAGNSPTVYTTQQYQNIYDETFYDTDFKSGGTTGNWDTTNKYLMLVRGKLGQSIGVDYNNGTITTATMTITNTTSGTYTAYLTADGASHWEQITSGVPYTFVNTGTDLRWKIVTTLAAYSVDGNTQALYHFEDGSGSTATDSTGSNNGYLSGSYSWSTSSELGTYALQFSGGFMTMATLLDTFPANGTIDFWFKPTSTWSGAGTNRFLLSKVNGPDQIFIGTTSLDSRIQFRFDSGSYVDQHVYTTANVWTAGTWYHIAVTWGAAGMKIYTYGVLDNSNSFTGVPTSAGTYDLHIASDYSGGNPLNVTVDEMRFSNSVRADFLAPIVTEIVISGYH